MYSDTFINKYLSMVYSHSVIVYLDVFINKISTFTESFLFDFYEDSRPPPQRQIHSGSWHSVSRPSESS